MKTTSIIIISSIIKIKLDFLSLWVNKIIAMTPPTHPPPKDIENRLISDILLNLDDCRLPNLSYMKVMKVRTFNRTKNLLLNLNRRQSVANIKAPNILRYWWTIIYFFESKRLGQYIPFIKLETSSNYVQITVYLLNLLLLRVFDFIWRNA